MMSVEKSCVEKFLLLVLFYFLSLGLFASYADIKLYESFFAVEDGFIEWLTVTALAMSAGLSLYRFFHLKSKPWLFRLCLLAAAAIFIFGIGEEISWGQRIFKVESSDFFKQYNSQGETNVHNLIFGSFRVNKIIFGAGLAIAILVYMVVIPWCITVSQKARELIGKLAIPVPRPLHIASYVFLFLVISACPSPKKGELLEFGGCMIFFLSFFNPLNSEIFD